MLDLAKETRSRNIESVKHNIKWIASSLLSEISKETLKEDISSHLYYYKNCSGHKIYELSSAALEFIEEGKTIAAANLIRAVQEAAAALHYLASAMLESLNIESTINIWTRLNELMAKEFNPSSQTPKINNNTENLKKIITEAGLEKEHNFLSEIVHPNSLGTTIFYSSINNETSLVHLGGHKNFIEEEMYDTQQTIRDICILSLKEALACFRASFMYIQNFREELDKYSSHNQDICLLPWLESNFFPFETNLLSLSRKKSSLEAIQQLIELSKITLVKQLNIEIFRAREPAQLLYYKSVMVHRSLELSVSALKKIEEDKIIVAMCLIRGTMETASALKYIKKKMDTSLQEKNISILSRALKKAGNGVKNSLEFLSNTELPKSQHVNDFLKEQNEEFRRDYNSLSDFIHPTLIGTTGLYTCLKHGNSSLLLSCSNCKQFDDNRSVLWSFSKDLCIRALGNSLFCFVKEEENIHQHLVRLAEKHSQGFINQE